MTLLISVLAAVYFTLLWYKREDRRQMRLDVPVFLFWGASIMWFVDAAAEYANLGKAYFTPEPYDMLNDGFLGLSVVALGCVIWVIVLLVTDPKGLFRGKQKR